MVIYHGRKVKNHLVQTNPSESSKNSSIRVISSGDLEEDGQDLPSEPLQTLG